MSFLADSMTDDIFYDDIFYDYLLACRPSLFFMKIIYLAPDVQYYKVYFCNCTLIHISHIECICPNQNININICLYTNIQYHRQSLGL